MSLCLCCALSLKLLMTPGVTPIHEREYPGRLRLTGSRTQLSPCWPPFFSWQWCMTLTVQGVLSSFCLTACVLGSICEPLTFARLPLTLVLLSAPIPLQAQHGHPHKGIDCFQPALNASARPPLADTFHCRMPSADLHFSAALHNPGGVLQGQTARAFCPGCQKCRTDTPG